MTFYIQYCMVTDKMLLRFKLLNLRKILHVDEANFLRPGHIYRKQLRTFFFVISAALSLFYMYIVEQYK